MNKDEMIQKVKDLIGEGNIDAAKQFVDEHKDDLGDFADKAKDLISNFDPSDIADKAKDVAGNLHLDDAADSVKDAVSHPEGLVDKIKDLFHHKG